MPHPLASRFGPVVLALACASPAPTQAQHWIRQYSPVDSVAWLARDGSGFFGAGATSTSQTGGDGSILRFDAQGAVSWRRTIAGPGFDTATAVAADGTGGAFVCGSTDGNLGGQNAGPQGHQDPWLARYDAAGNQLWIRQWGAAGSLDRALALAPDGNGGVYVAGDVPGPGLRDAWLARYDAAGTQRWAIPIGSSGSDIAWAVARAGDDGVFVGGFTGGNLGGSLSGIYDLWLARYDGTGTRVWTVQYGTAGVETLTELIADGDGGVFAAGAADAASTFGGAGHGGTDCWVGRFSSSGGQLWVRRIGTSSNDFWKGLTSDGSRHVFGCGSTEGGLGGTHVGAADAWIMDLDGAGTVVWTRQLGTTGLDDASAVMPTGGGFIVGGHTDGSLGGVSGSWIAHYAEPWSIAGAGIPGTTGKPMLSGSGTPERAQPIVLSLQDALPNAPVVHFIGGSIANLPIPGGILVPSPDVVVAGMTDSTGALRLGLTWPQSTRPGTRFWFQGCVLDPGAPHGLAASNALRAIQ